MKKFLIFVLTPIFLLSLLLFFVFLGSTDALFIPNSGLEGTVKQLMEQGNHIACLNAKTKEISVPKDWSKPAKGKIVVSGKTCNSPTGCKILRCNGSNTDLQVNEHLKDICKTHPEDWVGCKNEDKQKKIDEDIKKNVEVEPGCQEIKNYTILSRSNDNKVIKEVSAADGSLPLGPVNVEIDDSYIVHVDYQYYLSQPGETTLVDLGSGEAITPGQEQTQQLGTVTFNFNEATDEGSITDCEIISWDPYGRVFDAVSLEPMSDVKVTLIDGKTKTPSVMKFNSNNDFTDPRGVFNIQVENEGQYGLDVVAPLTHLFSETPNINPKYINIYSDIYTKGKVFQEKQGVPTHHDIPLQPVGEPYYSAVAELIEGSLQVKGFSSFVNYSGKTTFPFAKVCLVGAVSGKTVGKCVNADKFGNYSINVDKKEIPFEFLEVGIYKVDLNDVTKVNSRESRLRDVGYEPFLSYIEGYAYDEKGNKLTNTTVNVKLGGSGKTFSTTATDTEGKFIIYKSDLPFINYHLEYVNVKGDAVEKTTSEFLADNRQYIKNEALDLVLGTKNSRPIVDITKDYNGRDSQGIAQKPMETNTDSSIGSNRLFLILLILFLLVVLVIALIFFIKKNRQSE